MIGVPGRGRHRGIRVPELAWSAIFLVAAAVQVIDTATLAAAQAPAGAAPSPAAAEPAAAVAPDTLRASMTVNPAVVQLGERVHLRMAVPVPDSTARILAPPAPISFGDLDLLRSESTAAGGDSLAWTLELAIFRLGDIDVAAIPFGLEHLGQTRPVALPTYLVTVEASIPPDSLGEAGLRDIRGPMDPPLRWLWWRILLALSILGLLTWGLVRWWRRRGRKLPAILPAAPAIPPEVRALRALDDLAREALPARGMIKEHYFRLSLILRGFVEDRHRVPAVESTTHEIRETLGRQGLLTEDRGHTLLEVLEEADLVKFARFDPGVESADRALSRGRHWIESSAPTPAGEPRSESRGEVAV